MKLTTKRLKRLIREEIEKINEAEVSKKTIGRQIQSALGMVKDGDAKEKSEKELVRMYAVENDPKKVAKVAIEFLEPLAREANNSEAFQNYMESLKAFVQKG